MTKPHRLTILGIALAVTVFSSACNKTAQAPNDQQIVTSIQAKLYQNQTLKALPVNVTAEHGIVTLKGTVNAPLEKLAVDDIAEKTAGVKQVVDNLDVAPKPATQTSTASAAPAARPEPASTRRHRRRRSHLTADARSDAANHASQGPDQVPNSALEGSQDNSQPVKEPPSANAANAAPAAAPVPQSTPAPPAAPAPQAAPVPPVAPVPHAASTPPAPTPAPPPPKEVTIPAGTLLSVRMIDSINSETAQPDQTYKASISAPVVAGGQAIIPRGSNARVRVVEVQSAGRIRGQSELRVELARLTINGVRYKVESDHFTKIGQSQTKSSAEKIGGGAALGALLGGLLGHGAGAGVGAAIGAGAGTADQEATHGGQVTIPSEAKINFRLKAPLVVTLRASQ